MDTKRRKDKELYSSFLWGHFGRIGKGETQVRFFQSAITVSQLGYLTLVRDIPESRKWPIRELFQRDIDEERVEDEIVPYFKDHDQVKFFNPLTIALTPLDQAKKVIPVNEKTGVEKTEDGEALIVIEAKEFYKLTYPETVMSDCKLQWASHKTKLIAIDGQHRLKAINDVYQELLSDAKSAKHVGFEDWLIPIVVILFPANQSDPGAQLRNMRNVFVTINTTAQTPNKCRTLILNDKSLTAACTQELLGSCSRIGDAKDGTLPLIFFDWRAHKDQDDVENEPAFMRVEEMHDFLKHFLTMKDATNPDRVMYPTGPQETALQISDMDPGLDNDVHKRSEQLRGQFKDVILPSIHYILCNFDPLKEYVSMLSDLSKVAQDKDSRYTRFAIEKITFGSHSSIDSNDFEQIGIVTKYILDKMKRKKINIPELFSRLIGLRGVFSGFEQVIDDHNQATRGTAKLISIAEWYVGHLNKAVVTGLFSVDGPKNQLRYIALTPDNKISTGAYRLQNQKNRLGAYCALIALAGGAPGVDFSASIKSKDNTLYETVRSDAAKIHFSRLKSENQEKDDGELETDDQLRTKAQVLGSNDADNWRSELSATLKISN